MVAHHDVDIPVSPTQIAHRVIPRVIVDDVYFAVYALESLLKAYQALLNIEFDVEVYNDYCQFLHYSLLVVSGLSFFSSSVR